MVRYRKQPSVNMDTKPMTPGIGNVITDKKTIPVIINRYFTDVNGTVIGPADALVLATGFNEKFPFMFGEFDREGGYGNGLKIVPPVVGFFLTGFVNGVNFSPANIIGFNPLNTINQVISRGAVVQVYTDSLVSPSIFCWIVLQSSYSPLGSILTNTKTTQQDGRVGFMFIRNINYYYGSDIQLDESIHFTHYTNLGTFVDDSIDPNIWKDPYVALPDFITMNAEFTFDQYVEISGYIRYQVSQISLNLNIELY